MNIESLGDSTFRHLAATLDPGEELIAEAGSMASMSAQLELTTSLNGSLPSALIKFLVGGESLFINRFFNRSQRPATVHLTGSLPGDIAPITLKDQSIHLEPGSFLCATPGLKLGVRWAGFSSLIAREGLFKLVVSGSGTVWVNAYGKIFEREIDGDYIVDSGHLVAYPPSINLKVQLASGLFGSFFSGEGFVTRLSGKGKVLLQTRSVGALASWLNARI